MQQALPRVHFGRLEFEVQQVEDYIERCTQDCVEWTMEDHGDRPSEREINVHDLDAVNSIRAKRVLIFLFQQIGYATDMMDSLVSLLKINEGSYHDLAMKMVSL